MNVPTLDCMALSAVRTELPPMDVRVAIRAARPDFGEDQTRMAEGAGYLLVHAEQGVLCHIVIELGNASDRFPGRTCVAVFAGNVDWSVWVVARPLCVRLGGRVRQAGKQENQRNPDEFLHARWKTSPGLGFGRGYAFGISPNK